jgi:hypothetical protein
MAEASLFQDGIDRFQSAIKSVDKEVQRLQKEWSSRRRSFEKQVAQRRRTLEKRTQQQVDRLLAELRKNALVKRAEALQKDAQSRIETGVDTVLGVLQIASKSDVERIDKKLEKITKKLRDLEGGKPSKSQVSAA